MKNIFFFLLLLLSFHVFSQEEARQVIASAGDQHGNAVASLSWTLGETLSASLVNSAAILSQGFQQGSLAISNYSDPEMLNFSLKAYPNPVLDILILENEGIRQKYKVINMHGEVVLKGIIKAEEQDINFTNLPPGLYILSVDDKETHKIIKQ